MVNAVVRHKITRMVMRVRFDDGRTFTAEESAQLWADANGYELVSMERVA